MLYSTHELATYFGQNEQWVYSRLFELKIKPVKQTKSTNGIDKKNFYNIKQRTQIENHIIEVYSKKRNRILIVENNYHIYESKINKTSK